MFLTSCILVMRLPNHFYYTWRLISSLLIFVACHCSPHLFLLKLFYSPGRTGGFVFAEETKRKNLGKNRDSWWMLICYSVLMCCKLLVFFNSTNWNLSNSQTEIYLFLYVATIPTTEAKKVIGAILTNKNSNPCIIVPATANSGSL